MPVPSSIETKSAADHHVRVRRRWGTAARTARPTRSEPRSVADHVAPLADHRLAQGRGDDQTRSPSTLDHDVLGVGGRPRRPCSTAASRASWSTRPTMRRRRVGVGRLDDREPHEHARVVHRSVAQRHLGVGQRGAAPRAVGGDLVGLDQQAAFVQSLQRPPDGLDVVGVHRPVRVGQVDPEPDPLGESLELTDVALDRDPAALVELGDPERLDVPLARGADLLLDLDLDRQAVAVPATLPRHPMPGHRLVPRVDVLEGARLHVVDARLAVGRGWSLVEDPGGGALA